MTHQGSFCMLYCSTVGTLPCVAPHCTWISDTTRAAREGLRWVVGRAGRKEGKGYWCSVQGNWQFRRKQRGREAEDRVE